MVKVLRTFSTRWVFQLLSVLPASINGRKFDILGGHNSIVAVVAYLVHIVAVTLEKVPRCVL